MSGVIEHIERYLGKIQHGWTKSSTGALVPFKVVACKDGAIKGVTTFVTLGLSDVELASAVSEKLIRQELLIAVRSDDETKGVPSILQQIGSQALQKGSAYLRGDVIGPRGPLFEGSRLHALYSTLPVYYPQPFGTCVGPDGNHIVMTWMVPITTSEAEYIRKHGWSKFEDCLERRNPDLLDLERPSLL